MPWNQLIPLLPKIMESPPAIGAYCLLVIAFVAMFYRRQKSSDWRELLKSANGNSPAVVAIASQAGVEASFGGKLPDEMKLRLRMRQLTVLIVLSLIGAGTLIALSLIQARKDALTKQALLQQIRETSIKLQARVDSDQVNMANMMGDLGAIEGMARVAATNGQPAAELSAELHQLRERFSSSVNQRYLSKDERNQLVIADAVLAIVDGHIQAANQMLSPGFLKTLSASIEVNIDQALRANVVAIAARLRAKDYDGMIDCAQRILELRPDNWFALQQWAHALFLKGHFEEAVETLGRIDVNSKSGSDNWIFPAMTSGLKLTDPEEGRKSLELSDNINNALEVSPYASSFHLLPLIKSSEYPPSCDQSDREERQEFARNWLAGDLISHDRFEDARTLLTKAVDVCPVYIPALLSLAQDAVQLKLNAEAEKTLVQLSALTPLDSGHMVLLGLAQESLGKYEAAVVSLRKAIQISPSDPIAVNALGEIEANHGQNKEAIALFNSFLRRQWNEEVATSLTTVYEKTGLDRDVIKITSQILDADPTNNSMRYDRAMAFYKLANYKEALDGFKQVSSFESDANALYYAAISAGGLGKIDEGLNYANQLIATSQSYSECYFVRAQFLIRLHRYSEAISDLDKTKSRGEKISFLNYFYYLSFKALGDRDKAAIQCAALQQQTDVPDQIRTLVPSECTRRKG